MKRVEFVSKAVLFLMCLFPALFVGCSSSSSVGDGDSNDYTGKLINSELVASFTADDANSVIEGYYTPWGIDVEDLLDSSTDIDAYAIEYYTTDIDGQLIVVSGLVSIPSPADGVYPVVQYHHGTQFNNDDVPSNFERSDEAAITSALFAAHGYVTSLPDYIGQGASGVNHPYFHSESVARCSADMLKAVKELCNDLNISVSGKLFICGLSEGGHATMALQQYLETTDSEQAFDLAGSAPIAGPYDIPVCWNFWYENSPRTCSPLAAHLILSYMEIYGSDDTLDDIFIPPYNTTITDIDDGTYNSDEMYEMLPKTLPELLQAEFLASVNSGGHPISEEMELNNTYNFGLITPTRLFHARDDEQAPYAVSEIAYKEMSFLGASDLQLIDLGSDIDHVSSIFSGTFLAKEWFDTLK